MDSSNRKYTNRVFKRGGEGWSLAFNCEPVFLKDSKGLQHIHLLLRRSGQWTEVLEIATGAKMDVLVADGCLEITSKIFSEGTWERSKRASINVLDEVTPEAIASITCRKQVLIEDIEHLTSAIEMPQFNSSQEDLQADLDRAKAELLKLSEWLKENTFKGRARRSPTKAKEAYNSVRRAMERAFKAMKAQPELSGMVAHLQSRISYSTYTYCYLQDSIITWEL
jgi:hypothetical protein